MSAVTRPRGPLPSRVYWTRRVLLTVVALALVFGVARLVGGGGGGGAPAARPVAASESATPSVTGTPTGTAFPSGSATPTPTAATATPHRSAGSPLAQPTGSCPSGDVVATPTIKRHAYAGHPVVFEVLLTTRQSPACTWTVSAGSLAVKVVQETSGSSTSPEDRIWTTQQCRAAVPRQSVVLRPDTPAAVDVAWNGHRSDADCSLSTSWIETGVYHVVAAAYGSDPVDKSFSLVLAPVITVTASPKSTPTATPTGSSQSRRAKADASRAASPEATPSPTPTG
jgi:hypothetical protein